MIGGPEPMEGPQRRIDGREDIEDKGEVGKGVIKTLSLSRFRWR